MKIMILVFMFIILSCYLGLFIRLKIEGLKIKYHIFEIIFFPLYIFIIPIYLILLPFFVWNTLKKDKKFKLTFKIIFVMIFTYVVYKLFFSTVFFKFDSFIKIFLIRLKYKEKSYSTNIKSKVGDKFANYISMELRQDKLMNKYAMA